MGAGLEELYRECRAHPLEMALHLGTVAATGLMVLGVFAALVAGAPNRQVELWLAVIVAGTIVVMVWTVLVPVIEFLQDETDEHVAVEQPDQ